MSNYPDDYINEDFYDDAVFEYACNKFKTEDPTEEQMESAQEELEAESEMHINDDIN